MKTIATLVIAMMFAFSASAQFDVANLSASVSGNYTKFMKDFKKSTPGVKLDLGYSGNEKVRVSLGYTYHLAIKEPSVITAFDGTENHEVPSEFKYKFTTISLLGNYTFVGTEEEKFSLYGQAGGAFVMVKMTEEPKGAMPAGTIDSDKMEDMKENGLTINLGLGAQYNLSTLRLFADAGVALPANQANDVYVSNPIPFHLSFNVGVRIPFGTRSFED